MSTDTIIDPQIKYSIQKLGNMPNLSHILNPIYIVTSFADSCS